MNKFPHLFDLASDRWVIVEEMESRGWEEGVPLGSGGGAFLPGKRSALHSFLFSGMIFFCRIIFLTGGGGCSIPLVLAIVFSYHDWWQNLLSFMDVGL